MAKMVEKETIKVKLDIRPGLVSNYQRTCWKKFWTARIAEIQAELQAESEGKGER